MGKVKFILILFLVPVFLPLNSKLEELVGRRAKNSYLTADPILHMITDVEQGAYPLGFTLETAVDEILTFLKKDVPWPEKERVLSRMAEFFHLLPPQLKKRVREEFRKMDKIEYRRRKEKANTSDTTLRLPISFSSIILWPRIPLSELLYYIPLPRIEEHPYSRWLP